jgi:hypothetical protein
MRVSQVISDEFTYKKVSIKQYFTARDEEGAVSCQHDPARRVGALDTPAATAARLLEIVYSMR